MTHTISTTDNSLVTLFDTVDNPTTITTAGLLNAGLYADGASSNGGGVAAWTITSAGSILGAGLSVGLGSIGTIVNDGSISGDGDGVELKSGGIVTNAASAQRGGHGG
jgi:hypothetical protein